MMFCARARRKGSKDEGGARSAGPPAKPSLVRSVAVDLQHRAGDGVDIHMDVLAADIAALDLPLAVEILNLVEADHAEGTRMAEAAWIHGRSAPLDAAIAEAANLMVDCRLPVISGLGTDVAGARAAIKLAQCVGGVIDHMHSEALLRNLDVMREAGGAMTLATQV